MMRRVLSMLLLCVAHTSLLAAENHKRPRPSSTTIFDKDYIHPPSTYTVIVYMSAANDLWPFADRNIEQMKQVGSNEHLNILVHIDIRKPGYKKVTKRLFLQKNKTVQIGDAMCLDSGDEQTLIDTVKWAEDHFPAQYTFLTFWNHGSGDLNPLRWRVINPSTLFNYNPDNKLIELDRTIGFVEDYSTIDLIDRGICFDETTGNYLNDQKLKKALHEICAYRNGKKLDLIFFDACLMAGIGTAWLIHDFAHYMIASEELVLGTGADYAQVLLPLQSGTISPEEFGKHIVQCYKKTYGHLTNDYTQSAINLSKIDALANNINYLAELLIRGLDQQKNNSVKKALKESRNKFACTHFGEDEPNYLDLRHFYFNLLNHIKNIELENKTESFLLKENIKKNLEQGLTLINEIIIANVTGKNLKNAGGIYIYFPEKSIHPSFSLTEFAQNSTWMLFLTTYTNMQFQ
ncbi:MAG: clostripain-related cysteine peptidase [Candidatus Babeliaceae bacterium]|jgi:hypothetical protein